MGRPAAVLGTMAAMVLGGATLAEARPGSPATAIVSMGDSFISGEGGRWMGNGSEPFGTRSGTDRAAFGCDGLGICEYDPARIYGASEGDGCHRSDVAPIRSAPAAVEERVNLACSGARLVNLWPAGLGGQPHFGEPPQAEQLAAVARRDEVRMVVLTAGANDVGFGELVAGCALDCGAQLRAGPGPLSWRRPGGNRGGAPSDGAGLEKALRGVRATMAAAGYRRADYRLVTMGYASPFPAGRWIRYPEDGWSRLNEGGCPVWNADADWASGEATRSIVAAMREAASAAGAEFLDLQHALDGHQLCDRRSRRAGPEGPSPLSSEWVRRLAFVQGSTCESLHPNAYGQRAIGACLGLLYAALRGDYACYAQPGRSYVDGIGIERVG